MIQTGGAGWCGLSDPMPPADPQGPEQAGAPHGSPLATVETPCSGPRHHLLLLHRPSTSRHHSRPQLTGSCCQLLERISPAMLRTLCTLAWSRLKILARGLVS